MLVPEIALTPQTVGRFQARFGDTVALLHSALGEGERYDEWRRLRARRGADRGRAALGGLRAGRRPRARGRRRGARRLLQARGRPALRRPPRRGRARAAAPGARLLAGSATPRPETWRALPRLTLRERVDGRPLPPVRVLDMRGAGHPLHPETAARARRRAQGDRAAQPPRLVELPHLPQLRQGLGVPAVRRRARAAPRRRARSPATTAAIASPCRSAATPAARSRSRATAPGPSASSTSCARRSTCPVFRLDADTAGAKDAVPELLARFDAAPAGLLLGTQMVAKGHDFPDVTLGVVLDADSTLRFPDFRAEERTFALIAQLAGRAGRGPRGGRVLVQTRRPTRRRSWPPPSTTPRASCAGELARREALRYPPFADLIRIVFLGRGRRGARARRRARSATRSPRARAPGRRSSGPAPLFRLRGRERFQLVVKTPAPRGRRSPPCGAAVEARRARPRAPRRGVLRGRRPAIDSAAPMSEHADPHPDRQSRSRRRRSPPRSRPRRLDPETRARRDAALRLVRKYGDPSLQEPRAARSSASTTRCATEVRRMGQLMHDALGIGLAATQLGVMHRVLVYRVEPDAPRRGARQPGARVVRRGEGDARGGLPVAPGRARRRRAAGPRAGARAGRARRARS